MRDIFNLFSLTVYTTVDFFIYIFNGVFWFISSTEYHYIDIKILKKIEHMNFKYKCIL